MIRTSRRRAAAVGRCATALVLLMVARPCVGGGVLTAPAAPSADDGAEASRAPPGAGADAERDLSGVRSAALAWINAMWQGDAAAAHRVLVEDEAQRKLVARLATFNASLRHLEAVAVERFGAQGVRISGYPAQTPESVAASLEVELDGDEATARQAEATEPVRLRRVNGTWRVDLSDHVRLLARVAPASERAAAVAREVAAEIAAGKFASAEEARVEFRRRRLAAVERFKAP